MATITITKTAESAANELGLSLSRIGALLRLVDRSLEGTSARDAFIAIDALHNEVEMANEWLAAIPPH